MLKKKKSLAKTPALNISRGTKIVCYMSPLYSHWLCKLLQCAFTSIRWLLEKVAFKFIYFAELQLPQCSFSLFMHCGITVIGE